MRLLVSALEPSANLHLRYLLKELEGVEIFGIFDRELGEPLYGMDEFSVMGVVDVLMKYFKGKEAVAETILPKVWAWKRKRAVLVERYCDRLASIFPFESKFYGRAEYVGNPLLDEIEVKRAPYQKCETVAFLPGSRKSEVTRLMPVFKETAAALEGRRKLLVIPSFIDDKKISEWYGDISGFEVVSDTHEAIAQSHFAFVCSGTATLETALIGTPFVLVYKARRLDYAIGRFFVKLKYVGLANIILDFEGKEPLHPEIFQEDVNSSNLLRNYESMDRAGFGERSRQLREILRHGSASTVAKMIQ